MKRVAADEDSPAKEDRIIVFFWSAGGKSGVELTFDDAVRKAATWKAFSAMKR